MPRADGSVPVGRIIYTRRGLPAVELVNFALDYGDIVIRTDRSGKLAVAARGAVVAFEADQLDLAGQSGWSVTAIGPSGEMTDPGELARLQEIGLGSWAPGAREHFIRISPQLMNGRYLRGEVGDRPAADREPGTRAWFPVVRRDGRLAGIVSRSDVLTVFQRSDEEICREVTQDVIADGFFTDPARFTVTVHYGIVTLEGEPGSAVHGASIASRVEHLEGVVAVRDRFVYPARSAPSFPSDPGL